MLGDPGFIQYLHTDSFLVVSEKTSKNLCPSILGALSDGQLCFKGQIGVADLVYFIDEKGKASGWGKCLALAYNGDDLRSHEQQ